MSGPAITFGLLGRTENEAATPLITAALEASSLVVRTAAVRAALERRSPACLGELVARVDRMSDDELQVVYELHGRLTATLRDAVMGDDDARVALGFRAAVRFREYDLMPTLIGLLEEPGNRRAVAAAATLTDLADALVHELASIRDERRRRDPTLARNHAVTALEQSVHRYPEHGRREPLDALLQLASRDNAALLRILSDPRNPCFAPMVETLVTSDRPGVLRLLLGWLDDPRPPAAGLQALFRRTDSRTVEAVLRKVGVEPSPAVRSNLRRIDSIAFLADKPGSAELNEDVQQAAVAVAAASGLSPDDRLRVLERFARHGGGAGRKAAVVAAAELPGARAAALVLRALDDADPQVRAAALVQLRDRGIPGALATLLGALDDEAPAVREAARSQLHEYRLRRFLPAFDLLDDAVRRTTGRLVAKIDPSCDVQLWEELQSSQTKRRVRGLEAAAVMGLVDRLEDAVTLCAGDDEQAVRIEAARALATASGAWADHVLRSMSSDEAFAVRETVREILEQRAVSASAPSAASAGSGAAEVAHDE